MRPQEVSNITGTLQVWLIQLRPVKGRSLICSDSILRGTYTIIIIITIFIACTNSSKLESEVAKIQTFSL